MIIINHLRPECCSEFPRRLRPGIAFSLFSALSALLVGHGTVRTRAVALLHVTMLSGNSFHYAIRYTRYSS